MRAPRSIPLGQAPYNDKVEATALPGFKKNQTLREHDYNLIELDGRSWRAEPTRRSDGRSEYVLRRLDDGVELLKFRSPERVSAGAPKGDPSNWRLRVYNSSDVEIQVQGGRDSSAPLLMLKLFQPETAMSKQDERANAEREERAYEAVRGIHLTGVTARRRGNAMF